jgi:hypothetical protein
MERKRKWYQAPKFGRELEENWCQAQENWRRTRELVPGTWENENENWCQVP